MEFKAEPNPRVAFTLDGKAEITLTAPRSSLQVFEGLQDSELIVSVKKYSKRRSLTQNAYMWVLIGELSQKLGISKNEIYKSYVKDFGIYEILPIRKDAVDRFIKIWNSKGLGWLAETLKESKLDGYYNIIAYYGSSSYDKNEMKRLIDAVVNDCADQGIETMPMSDIMLLKGNDE